MEKVLTIFCPPTTPQEQHEPQQDLQDLQLPAEGQKNGGAPPADPPIENANGSEKNNA